MDPINTQTAFCLFISQRVGSISKKVDWNIRMSAFSLVSLKHFSRKISSQSHTRTPRCTCKHFPTIPNGHHGYRGTSSRRQYLRWGSPWYTRISDPNSLASQWHNNRSWHGGKTPPLWRENGIERNIPKLHLKKLTSKLGRIGVIVVLRNIWIDLKVLGCFLFYLCSSTFHSSLGSTARKLPSQDWVSVKMSNSCGWLVLKRFFAARKSCGRDHHSYSKQLGSPTFISRRFRPFVRGTAPGS